MTNSPIALSCLCGNVGLTVSSQPNFLHQCNCTLCKKTGAQWAYFPPKSVSCEGITQPFCRADKDDPGAEIHFCGKCGCTTHFVLTESAIAQHGNTMMGVILLVVGGVSSALAAMSVDWALVFLAVLGLIGAASAISMPEVSRGAS